MQIIKKKYFLMKNWPLASFTTQECFHQGPGSHLFEMPASREIALLSLRFFEGGGEHNLSGHFVSICKTTFRQKDRRKFTFPLGKAHSHTDGL